MGVRYGVVEDTATSITFHGEYYSDTNQVRAVRFYLDGELQETRTFSLTSNIDQEYTYTGLSPATEYKLEVVYYDDSWDEIVRNTSITHYYTDAEKVEKVDYHRHYHDGFLISFKTLPSYKSDYYKIYVRNTDGDIIYDEDVYGDGGNAGVIQHRIDGLSSGTEYSVYIANYNNGQSATGRGWSSLTTSEKIPTPSFDSSDISFDKSTTTFNFYNSSYRSFVEIEPINRNPDLHASYSIEELKYFLKIAASDNENPEDEGRYDYWNKTYKYNKPTIDVMLYVHSSESNSIAENELQDVISQANSVMQSSQLNYLGVETYDGNETWDSLRSRNGEDVSVIIAPLDILRELEINTDYSGWNGLNGVRGVSNGEIDRSFAMINMDAEEYDGRRHHLIAEEVIQSLGLQNDQIYDVDSIFSQQYTETTDMSNMDEVALRLLYDNETPFDIKRIPLAVKLDIPFTVSDSDSDTVSLDISGLRSDKDYRARIWISNSSFTEYSEKSDWVYFTTPYIPPRPDYFEWDTPKRKDEAFNITASEWNRFTQNINDVREHVDLSPWSFTTVSSGQIFKDDYFEEVVRAIKDMPYAISPLPTKYKTGAEDAGRAIWADKLIAEEFNQLRDGINSVE